MESYEQSFYIACQAAVHTVYMHGTQRAETFCVLNLNFYFPEDLGGTAATSEL
jgi:hypothetical protein